VTRNDGPCRAARKSTPAWMLVPLVALACGGSKTTPPPAVGRETAEAEVTRIARTWTSTQVERSILSPPSPISVRRATRTSRLVFGSDAAQETLVVSEQFDLRAGGTIRCQTNFEHAVRLRWGRKSGEAAVEITRPPLAGARSCDGPAPDGALTEPERRALFVLGSDQLGAVEPPLDERIYRPASD
jgi:hypothetical protein